MDIYCFATCNKGLEEVLAAELAAETIQAKEIKVGSSGVYFKGTWETGYRANLWLRTAVRVLAELSTQRVEDAATLYEWVRRMPWWMRSRQRSRCSADEMAAAIVGLGTDE